MTKATGRILKSDDVVLQGRFYLGASEGTSEKNNITMTAEPQVKIVENQNDYAIISVTCQCGSETFVRCEYAQPQTQN